MKFSIYINGDEDPELWVSFSAEADEVFVGKLDSITQAQTAKLVMGVNVGNPVVDVYADGELIA